MELYRENFLKLNSYMSCMQIINQIISDQLNKSIEQMNLEPNFLQKLHKITSSSYQNYYTQNQSNELIFPDFSRSSPIKNDEMLKSNQQTPNLQSFNSMLQSESNLIKFHKFNFSKKIKYSKFLIFFVLPRSQL
eukprot:Anaeramoba_ignava/a611410_9.p1 GENE.a611410_9~~a611410_9.p1  ORF type:complete len:134 (-),score=31.06 a611410_9:225-626(-)